MGHNVQHVSMGLLSWDYSHEVEYEYCRCINDENHCLQSREYISAAQLEGWAHFYAADLFNSGAQSNSWFAYYKQFNFFGFPLYPPVHVDAYGNPQWIRNHCNAIDTGSELDWLTFYWWINNKGTYKYNYTDMKNVYRQACTGGTGNCNPSQNVHWNNLQSAVNTLFIEGSNKAIFWADTGDAKGVNLSEE
jgi:hypothetical protein